MRNTRFDWRWVWLIVGVATLANASRIPEPVLALLLAAGGGYLLYYGWQVWGGSSFKGTRVQYWRGQRFEVRSPRRTGLPPLSAIGPAALYLVLGLVFLLSAVAIALP